MIQRIISIALAMLILIGLTDQTVGQNQTNDELSAPMAKLGFSVVPLEQMSSGHLVAKCKLNGSEELRFVCDSGSGGTLITPETCKELKLESQDTGQFAGGVGGGGFGMSKAKLKSFQVGSTQLDMSEILVIDISHVNGQFESIGEKPVHGIIGSDWMQGHQAILDVASARMFFKPSNESAAGQSKKDTASKPSVKAAPQGRASLGIQVGSPDGSPEVGRTVRGGAADKAGIKNGDVIVGFDGTEIGSFEELLTHLGGAKPGQVVKMDVKREGEKLTLDVTLGSAGGAQQPKVGIKDEKAPKWNIQHWDGLNEGKTSLDISDLKGKVVYLYCFQSWCPACKSHGFPTLKEVREKYSDADDVEFVVVQTVFEGFDTNTKENGKKMVREEFGLDVPLGIDGSAEHSSSIMSDYHTQGTPWTVIIDKEGVVRENNFLLEAGDAIKLIDELRK